MISDGIFLDVNEKNAIILFNDIDAPAFPLFLSLSLKKAGVLLK
jgi:hypothetical protein